PWLQRPDLRRRSHRPVAPLRRLHVSERPWVAGPDRRELPGGRPSAYPPLAPAPLPLLPGLANDPAARLPVGPDLRTDAVFLDTGRRGRRRPSEPVAAAVRVALQRQAAEALDELRIADPRVRQQLRVDARGSEARHR